MKIYHLLSFFTFFLSSILLGMDAEKFIPVPPLNFLQNQVFKSNLNDIICSSPNYDFESFYKLLSHYGNQPITFDFYFRRLSITELIRFANTATKAESIIARIVQQHQVNKEEARRVNDHEKSTTESYLESDARTAQWWLSRKIIERVVTVLVEKLKDPETIRNFLNTGSCGLDDCKINDTILTEMVKIWPKAHVSLFYAMLKSSANNLVTITDSNNKSTVLPREFIKFFDKNGSFRQYIEEFQINPEYINGTIETVTQIKLPENLTCAYLEIFVRLYPFIATQHVSEHLQSLDSNTLIHLAILTDTFGIPDDEVFLDKISETLISHLSKPTTIQHYLQTGNIYSSSCTFMPPRLVSKIISKSSNSLQRALIKAMFCTNQTLITVTDSSANSTCLPSGFIQYCCGDKSLLKSQLSSLSSLVRLPKDCALRINDLEIMVDVVSKIPSQYVSLYDKLEPHHLVRFIHIVDALDIPLDDHLAHYLRVGIATRPAVFHYYLKTGKTLLSGKISHTISQKLGFCQSLLGLIYSLVDAMSIPDQAPVTIIDSQNNETSLPSGFIQTFCPEDSVLSQKKSSVINLPTNCPVTASHITRFAQSMTEFAFDAHKFDFNDLVLFAATSQHLNIKNHQVIMKNVLNNYFNQYKNRSSFLSSALSNATTTHLPWFSRLIGEKIWKQVHNNFYPMGMRVNLLDNSEYYLAVNDDGINYPSEYVIYDTNNEHIVTFSNPMFGDSFNLTRSSDDRYLRHMKLTPLEIGYSYFQEPKPKPYFTSDDVLVIPKECSMTGKRLEYNCTLLSNLRNLCLENLDVAALIYYLRLRPENLINEHEIKDRLKVLDTDTLRNVIKVSDKLNIIPGNPIGKISREILANSSTDQSQKPHTSPFFTIVERATTPFQSF